MLELPHFKAAAVQTAPVFLDTDATVDKVVRLIGEAAGNGARLVAFPEVFVSAYPYWSWIGNPVEGSAWFEKLVRSAIEIPGPEIAKIAQAAARHRINVVVGANERNRHGIGTIYNTLVTIAEDGRILGRHRKLVPTWAEKLTWAPGDASALRVHDTSIGPLGSLACGENTNTLARFSLIAQGELVHVASYISLPVAPPDYDMAEAIKVRAAAHSFEGKLFTIVSCSTISEEIIAALEGDFPKARELLLRKNSAFSAVLGPDGRVIGQPLIDEEGIVYADIDLSRCIQPRQMHDISGHYNRFDVFDLRVNRRSLQAVRFDDAAEPAPIEPVTEPGQEPQP
ncbi:carbon-nitrogen hydrolase family protein [Verminephrobacter eiseniae]|uniref:Nitrilase/cyanide hydratase and apolipoprotein N-acyltransferase n=1 Tax=Verminephrobacter eiseniae (strain EF01-2) TaxID=391735 RepID=A1WQK4_VEREI|nr:carbon-nitrogen hydrolase family protein [Verminephrobacter eiseniae]ABM59911.1 Nitrilase/cyanide hydratase and apolipoprotein N-acyltransferase [Verminephrobacter eiseniae EF01-2]MCW5285419.1 carbon-nitrogen hydrolase family protein [Verminephrobacter eiseniae]MCW5303719.1 carbon-nitrogen hydrolase family protein [Verminephrobacter eiseniae]MCW8181904.1 carbon-nitrogen hydrolase family protein [Verminephrobacter eiseniae]MCW8191515.1 carbon-nitrogen hydrolase family protein [Verminephrobac